MVCAVDEQLKEVGVIADEGSEKLADTCKSKNAPAGGGV